MTKPYYQQDGITIYHGDCRDVLPCIGECDVVLTDPPYGIDYSPDNSRFTSQRTKWWTVTDRNGVSCFDKIDGDDKSFSPENIPIEKPCILWGANHYADRLPASGGWLVWDKRAGLEDVGERWPMSEGELAWCNVSGHLSIFRLRWFGMIRPENEKKRFHPFQKPVALMRWCLGKMPDGVVLDPYMGAGSSLIAAKLEGRGAVGVELEEKYCEIAARRLDQKVFEFAD